VYQAIHHTASRKTAGPEEVLVEFLKEDEDAAVTRMHKICLELMGNGRAAGEWTSSVFISLPRKEI